AAEGVSQPVPSISDAGVGDGVHLGGWYRLKRELILKEIPVIMRGLDFRPGLIDPVNEQLHLTGQCARQRGRTGAGDPTLIHRLDDQLQLVHQAGLDSSRRNQGPPRRGSGSSMTWNG